MRSRARKIKKIKVKDSGNDLQEEQVDVDDLDDLDEKDTTVTGILNRLRYHRDSVTATEWSSLYDMRLKNIEKLKKHEELKFLLEKWTLYSKSQEYVR